MTCVCMMVNWPLCGVSAWIACNRVDLGCVDAVRGAETMRELELGFIEVDRNDRIGARHARADDRRQPHTAHAEDRDTLTAFHARGIEDGASAGHHRAADDRRHVVRRAWIDFDHVLFVGERVVGPRKDIFGLGDAIGNLERRAHWQAFWRARRRAAPTLRVRGRRRAHGAPESRAFRRCRSIRVRGPQALGADGASGGVGNGRCRTRTDAR